MAEHARDALPPEKAAQAPPAAVILAMLGSLYAWALFLSTFRHPGSIGWDFNAPGTDDMVFYAAIKEALSGRLDILYDPDRFTAALNARFHDVLTYPLTFVPWVYPPTWLVLVMPFAILPFTWSYALFQLVSAAALFASLRGLGGRSGTSIAVAAAALLSPAAAINAVYGQAAFLTAALLIGGTRLLTSRPYSGGAILGMLCIKPQLAILIPVVLVATRNGKAALGAVASALCLSAGAALVFGASIWTGWFASAAHNLSGGYAQWFMRGQIWDNSVQTCLYLLGVSLPVAAILAPCVAVAAAGMVYAVLRSDRPDTLKLAVLFVSATLAAPHIGPYDLILLVVGAALFLNGLNQAAPGWVWTLAVYAWMLPVLDQPVVSFPARLGPLVAAALMVRFQQGKSRVKSASPPRRPVFM